MSNYSATVVKLGRIIDHSNADRLKITFIHGNSVIVGLNAKEGDVGLFYPCESQIGLEFAVANDLIRRKDDNGKVVGGLFDENRRVRCQSLRGEKSMGFWIPMDSLAKTLQRPLEEVLTNYPVNTEIENIGSLVISSKYVPKSNKTEMSAGKQPKLIKKSKSRIIDEQFKFHFDTSHLGKNLHMIKPDSLVAITWKMHGSSFIVGHCLVKKKLTFIENLLKKFKVNIVDTEYDYVYSSRKVIKNAAFNEDVGPGYYGEDIWTRVGEELKGSLHEGETLYGEICGFTKEGAFIQKNYDYGCKIGEHKIYVYRITRTNSEGHVTELSWPQVKERCNQIGVEHVPEIYYGKAGDLVQAAWDFSSDENWPEDKWNEFFLDYLTKRYVYDQDCQFCNNSIPSEGVVTRLEGLEIKNYKLKSFRFLQHESGELDKGTIDMETEQSV